jgi:glycosyltransferase involved in cell wall biosynthesis
VAKALAGVDVEARREAVIRALGCRQRIALVAGRLVPMKGLSELLRAWELVPAAVRADWSLVFVGSGPLATRIAEAQDAAAPGEIVHVPALQPQELVGFYAAAELLVFPSLGDPWGLVVNEAFACGRPVLCSRLAGCADDLLRPGANGWLSDPTDADAFAQTLAEALTSSDLARLGTGARATAERLRPERMADGLRDAVLHATAPA